jgi:hypothetical protein
MLVTVNNCRKKKGQRGENEVRGSGAVQSIVCKQGKGDSERRMEYEYDSQQ